MPVLEPGLEPVPGQIGKLNKVGVGATGRTGASWNRFQQPIHKCLNFHFTGTGSTSLAPVPAETGSRPGSSRLIKLPPQRNVAFFYLL